MNIKRAQVEMSSRCNYKCITCKHGYCEYGEDLPADICDMLIKDVLPDLDVLELQGTGESLLSTWTRDFINAATQSNTEVTLITNGSLLTEKIMDELVSAGIQLVISLDGSNEEIYKAHRPVGNFNKVIENMKRLNSIRNANLSSKFSLVVNMVLTTLNCTDILDMIHLLNGLGANYLFVSEVRECMPDPEIWNTLNLLSDSSTPEFKDMIAKCEMVAKRAGIGFAFNPNIKPKGIQKAVCEAPWKHIFVSANGDVSVCCELSKTFGNLNRQGLSEILCSKALKKFQDEMLQGNYDQHCLNCCLPWGLPY